VSRLTWRRLVAVTLGLGIVSWGVNLLITRSGSPLRLSWSVSVALVIAAMGTLGIGWEVRQYREGKRPGLSPFKAAKTAVFAQAAALTGAALVGLYGGYAAALVGDWGHLPRRGLILTAILASASAALLGAAGWVAERWCALDDGDDDYPGGTTPEAA
jgi:polyferredoxin